METISDDFQGEDSINNSNSDENGDQMLILTAPLLLCLRPCGR